MAQRTQVLYVDDLDGSPAEGTVRFELDGTDYEIDLNRTHKDQFARAVRPYVDAARKAHPHLGGQRRRRVLDAMTSLLSGHGPALRA